VIPGGHDRHEENVAPYLLGALPELEATAFTRHLMGCTACREELERLRPAADVLPRAVDTFEPPPGLKASLMRAIDEDGTADHASSPAPVEAPDPSPVRVEASRRPSWKLPRLSSPMAALRPTAAWASAAVFLVAGAAGGWGISQLNEPEVQDDSLTVSAKVDRSRFTRGTGSLVLPDRDGQTAVLRVQGMRPAPKGKVYEIWVQRGEEVAPASLFTVGADGTGLGAVSQDLSEVDAVFVTRERASGAAAPTEEPVVRVDL